MYGVEVTVTFNDCDIYSNTVLGPRCSLMAGGGVFVQNGQVTFLTCQIHNNEAADVMATRVTSDIMFSRIIRLEHLLTLAHLANNGRVFPNFVQKRLGGV